MRSLTEMSFAEIMISIIIKVLWVYLLVCTFFFVFFVFFGQWKAFVCYSGGTASIVALYFYYRTWLPEILKMKQEIKQSDERIKRFM